MFLSFIVPVYNTEKYLSECLDSLLNQDIPKDEYEIICVNDGSTDRSLEILRTYAQLHQNIRVVDKPNEGVSIARNVGLEAAIGEYVWMVDSDDFIKTNSLGMIREEIIAKQPDRLKVGTFTFNDELTDEEKNAINDNTLCVNSHFYDSVVWGSVLLREFMLKNNCGVFYPDIAYGEDSIFMFEVVANNPKCFELDIPFYFYRNRTASATTSKSKESHMRRLESHFNGVRIIKQHYDNGVGEAETTANFLMMLIWCVMNDCALLTGGERRTMVRKAKTEGIYPFTRPDACTLARSYQTTRTNAVGKIFDKVYINTHRPWGFWTMCCIKKLIALKQKS